MLKDSQKSGGIF